MLTGIAARGRLRPSLRSYEVGGVASRAASPGFPSPDLPNVNLPKPVVLSGGRVLFLPELEERLIYLARCRAVLATRVAGNRYLTARIGDEFHSMNWGTRIRVLVPHGGAATHRCVMPAPPRPHVEGRAPAMPTRTRNMSLRSNGGVLTPSRVTEAESPAPVCPRPLFVGRESHGTSRNRALLAMPADQPLAVGSLSRSDCL
jgi:hypothetical protein